jgi:hypothetical protein
VTGTHGGIGWIVLAVRIPAQPSRHRVAVWRELRRIGALPIGQGTWAVPDVPAFAEGVRRVLELTDRGPGEVVTFTAAGRSEKDVARMARLFTEARQEEWTEFVADCEKFTAEIDKEIGKGKLTVAELEEEEHSLERLRRWHRELKIRDVFKAALAPDADRHLACCVRRLDEYTQLVFQAVHGLDAEPED